MALTKISTGGVKDDAASQAIIADEAVDEARLQVSNAGTNGQFLSKQSGNTGGLTWADVTIPDADKCIEGNTSVEAVDTGSDGHVKITTEGTERVRVDSTGRLLLGTTDPSGYNGRNLTVATASGSCGIEIRSSTNDAGQISFSDGYAADDTAYRGYIQYQHNGDDMRFATSSSERLRLASSGQIGIGGANYGSSGQVLTSGGASAAPSWAAIPPAGNTVDLVADGAIAAGKPCIIKPNGKAAQVGESMTVRGTPTTLGQTWAYNTDTDLTTDESKYSASVNCGTNLIFSMWFNETDDVWTVNVTYIDDTSNNNIKVKYSTGLTDSVLGTVNSNASVALAYLGNNKVCIFWNGKSTNAGTAVIAEINSTTRAVTFGSDISVSATGRDLAVSYDTDNERILFAYDGNSSNNGYYQSASFSGTAITLLGSATQFALVNNNNGVRSINSVYDTNADRHVIVYDYKDYGNKAYAFSVETTGSSMTASSLNEFSETAILSETMGLDVCFDSVNNRTVVRWSEASNANAKLRGLICNPSTGAITASGSVTNTVGTYINSNFHSDMIFDAISGRPYHVAGFQSGNHWIVFYYLEYNSSNGTYSTNGGGAIWATSEVRKYISLAPFGNTGGDIQAMANRHFESSATDRHHGVVRMSTMASATNLTTAAQNFLGFAEDAISDGATGTIKLQGNVVGNQSGLTPATWYAVNGNGTLSSGGGATSAGGLAVASDKLRIKEVPKS